MGKKTQLNKPVSNKKKAKLEQLNEELYALKEKGDFAGAKKRYESSNHENLLEEAVEEVYANFNQPSVTNYSVKKLQLAIDELQSTYTEIQGTYSEVSSPAQEKDEDSDKSRLEKRDEAIAEQFEKAKLEEISPHLQPYVQEYLNELKKNEKDRNRKILINSLFGAVSRKAVDYHYTSKREIDNSYIENWISYSLRLNHSVRDTELLSELYREVLMKPASNKTNIERLHDHLRWVSKNINRIQRDLAEISKPESINNECPSFNQMHAYIKDELDCFDFYTRVYSGALKAKVHGAQKRYQISQTPKEQEVWRKVYEESRLELTQLYKKQLKAAQARIVERKQHYARELKTPIDPNQPRTEQVEYSKDKSVLSSRTRKQAEEKFSNALILEARNVSKSQYNSLRNRVKRAISQEQRFGFKVRATVSYLTGQLSQRQYDRWVRGKTPSSKAQVFFEQLTGQISRKEAKYYYKKIEEKRLKGEFGYLQFRKSDKEQAKAARSAYAEYEKRCNELYKAAMYKNAGVQLYSIGEQHENQQQKVWQRERPKSRAQGSGFQRTERERDLGLGLEM